MAGRQSHQPREVLRFIAALIIRSPDRRFILEDLDELLERDLADGLPSWRARWRYGRNMIASAFSVWRTRLRIPVPDRASLLDVKLGFRMLVKYPGLTVVGGLAMAFAIGAGAGTFEVIKRTIDPRLPLPDGEHVIGLRYWDRAENTREFPTVDDFLIWREGLTTVEDVGAFRLLKRNLAPAGEETGMPVEVAEISAAGFRVTRVPPVLGRALVEADEDPEAPAVVVLGHQLWQTRFGGDPAVVGRVVRLGNVRATVVGVMPEGFAFPIDHNLWTPLRAGELFRGPGRDTLQGPLGVFARLAPGVTLAEAQAEATTLAARAAADFPERYEHRMPEVLPYAASMVRNPASLYSINVFAALFLTLVCGNVALLMFARAATREREILVRNALGASRGRIMTQLFVEALVLAAFAAVLGIAATNLGLRWVMGLIRADVPFLPFWLDGGLSPMTLTYAGLLTLLAAAIAGVVPALKVTGRGMEARLRQATAGAGGLRMGGIWTGVIIVQIAATVLFTAVTYLVQRQAAGIASVEAGFPAEEYLAVRLETDTESRLEDSADTTGDRFARGYTAIVQELERRLAAEPAVADVTVAERLPLMWHPSHSIELDGAGAGAPSRHHVGTAAVDLDFFDVFQTPVLSGRGFDSRDLDEGVNTVVVNTAFVDKVLAGRNAVGQRIRYNSFRERGEPRSSTEPGPWLEIVGVVPDLVRESRSPLYLEPPERARLYHPLRPGQAPSHSLYLAAHVRGDPGSLAPTLRRIAGEVSPTLRLYDIQPLDEATSGDAWFWNALAGVILLASAIALILSLAGIYSVMSFTVSRRTREIGVRVALGAQAPRVVADIFRRPLGHLVAGVAVGWVLVGALVAISLNGSNLMTGPMTARYAALLFAYGIVMMGVCAFACVGPTLRALRVEPTEALREEG